MTEPTDTVSVRYMVDDVEAAVAFYTKVLGFETLNRIHLIVDDIDAEVAHLRDAGAQFRNEIVEGPAGKQILVLDPSGNVIELFEWAK